MERATESTNTPITGYVSPLLENTEIPEPSSPTDQLTKWIMFKVFEGASALLKTMDIRQRVSELLPDELDEDFPSDLGKEFWETMEKIALAWNGGLRAEVTKMLQSEGFSVEWFKWGHSSGFPVLVVKLNPTPEPDIVWDIADRLHELIDGRLRTNTACLIHP